VEPLVHNNWLATWAGLPHNNGMHVQFLLGPAGSGKTFRCLSEIREELVRCADGPELILLAPKQATFQLERQLLSDDRVPGYTRLQILSFERLAAHLFDRLGRPVAELLSEEGRVMVLRAVLEQQRDKLRVFRASARMAGFARQLSTLLRDLQRRKLGPRALEELAVRPGLSPQLADKLSDLAVIHRNYMEWINGAGGCRLEDAARLLDLASDALRDAPRSVGFGGLWLDGFAEMTPQEQALLAAVLPHCRRATLAFCLPRLSRKQESWLSPWAVVSETVQDCHARTCQLPGTEVGVEVLQRDPTRSRFARSPVLAEVEQVFAGEWPEPPSGSAERGSGTGQNTLRLVECSNVAVEVMAAAREILRFVRNGGRYRDCAVLMRDLEGFQDALRRGLSRYGIPFFLDRRETVSHHPLAELTRFALRTVAFDWRLEDWLGALKTGLAGLDDPEVDRLENAALARGWNGSAVWLQPFPRDQDAEAPDWLEQRRRRATAPFAALHQRLRTAEPALTGAVLAAQLRALWSSLEVERRLEDWARLPDRGSVQTTVWEQMNEWVDNLERAFREVPLSLREWLQIVEAGLSGLSVGVIPPALDQVLVGSVDRSRNPDLKLTVVLGANESIFPAPPPDVPLLSETDVADLESNGVRIGPGRRQFGHERYLGYIALTRARQCVLVTWSALDAKGRPQNPSRLVDEIRRVLPGTEVESFDGQVSWTECQHPIELVGTVLTEPAPAGLQPLVDLPAVRPVVRRWREAMAALREDRLSPAAAVTLYGEELKLSVTALEQFAACPFQFFVARGLKAQERDEFTVDARRTGEFQHEVLAEFHRRVTASGNRWRAISPDQAAAWLHEIGTQRLAHYQHGLFSADAAREFQAHALIRNLEQLVTTLTLWSSRNEFEPAAVEVGFGLESDGWPAWRLDLGGGRFVTVRGRVDRVDLLRRESGGGLVAIVDYKSSARHFEEVKFENGLQLQMPAYLNAICENAAAKQAFEASTLVPAGLFYIGLRVRPESGGSRELAEEKAAAAAVTAFQHRGRFDAALVEQFDNSGASQGTQFKFSFNKDGSLSKRGNDLLPHHKFSAMLESASDQIRSLARRILSGEAGVSPYQKGQEVACDWCKFRPVCRFDSWTQPYRVLKRRTAATETGEGSA